MGGWDLHEMAGMNNHAITKLALSVGYNQSDTTVGFSGEQEKC